MKKKIKINTEKWISEEFIPEDHRWWHVLFLKRGKWFSVERETGKKRELGVKIVCPFCTYKKYIIKGKENKETLLKELL